MVRAIILIGAISAASGFVAHTGCGGSNQLHRVATKISARQDQHPDDSRRRALGTIATIPSFWAAHAEVSSATPKLRPDDAYASLVKARQELQVAGATYLSKNDWEGLRAYLNEEAVNMNSYEANAQALLESKRLDAESKKDIGTIRRYGVGADVIIMYGGLKNEVDEENESPNFSAAGKYLKRTMDALDEVISICRSNGFDWLTS